MKYMIHSCNQRQWYVDGFLVPSLLKQGIKESDIYVYQDKTRAGNLVSWVVSCHVAYEMWGDNQNVWHLQDDVIVCRDFKERTEELEKDDAMAVCAFTCKYDDNRGPGRKPLKDHMWYSFPCIRLRTSTMKEFANWADTYVWRDNQYGLWIRQKKGDDFIFRVFIESYYPNEIANNVIPNLVDHVDYLVGGTVVNPQRQSSRFDVRSMYWDDQELVDELEKEIAKL